MKFRVRHATAGDHVHCRLFVGSGAAGSKCGSFVVRKGEEFEALRSAMRGAEFLPEDDAQVMADALRARTIAEVVPRTEKLVSALELLASLLREATRFKGYGDGPLKQPAVEMALRRAEALANEGASQPSDQAIADASCEAAKAHYNAMEPQQRDLSFAYSFQGYMASCLHGGRKIETCVRKVLELIAMLLKANE